MLQVQGIQTEGLPKDATKQPEDKQRAYVFLDLETTGLSILKHGICQIGAYVTREDESDFVGYFVEDADPTRDDDGNSTGIQIEQSAFDVNKFTKERLALAEPLENVLCRFHAFLTKLAKDNEIVLVMHGAKFDTPRIEVAFERVSIQFPWSRRVLCTVSVGFPVLGKKISSLAGLSQVLGIHNRMAHDALGDAITTSKVFHALLRKSKELPCYQSPTLIPYMPLPGSYPLTPPYIAANPVPGYQQVIKRILSLHAK